MVAGRGAVFFLQQRDFYVAKTLTRKLRRIPTIAGSGGWKQDTTPAFFMYDRDYDQPQEAQW